MARGRIGVADFFYHLAIRFDGDAFGDQIGADHGLDVVGVIILGMATARQCCRIKIRFAVQLDDALGQPVGVFLLLVGVFEELGLDRAVLQARHRVVVALVAQHTDQLGGQRAVQQRDDAYAVALVAIGDRAVGEVLGGGADRGRVQAVFGEVRCSHDSLPWSVVKWRGLTARGDRTAVLRQHDLDAAVQLAVAAGVVGGHRIGFAIALGGDAAGVHAHADQRGAHRFGAALRQVEVVGGAAGAVGEAFDQHGALGILRQHVGQLAGRPHAVGAQFGAVGVEQHVAEGDDHAALGLLGLQVGQLGGQRGGARLRVGRGGLGVGGAVLRLHGLHAGLVGGGLGLVGFLSALLQTHFVALAAGVGDARLFGFLVRHLLRGGDLLRRDISELVDVFQAVVFGGGVVGAVQRVAGGLEFQRRAGGHGRIVLRRHVVAACAVEHAGGGRRAAAGGHEQGDGEHGRDEGQFFHDGSSLLLLVGVAAIEFVTHGVDALLHFVGGAGGLGRVGLALRQLRVGGGQVGPFLGGLVILGGQRLVGLHHLVAGRGQLGRGQLGGAGAGGAVDGGARDGDVGGGRGLVAGAADSGHGDGQCAQQLQGGAG